MDDPGSTLVFNVQRDYLKNTENIITLNKIQAMLYFVMRFYKILSEFL